MRDKCRRAGFETKLLPFFSHVRGTTYEEGTSGVDLAHAFVGLSLIGYACALTTQGATPASGKRYISLETDDGPQRGRKRA
jgi:hypothetical protein